MSIVFDAGSLEWKPVRPDMTRGVYGKTLSTDGVKIVLTRVEPGGSVSRHIDDYGHLFYFLSGEGLIRLGQRQSRAREGTVVRVEEGEAHAYENTGTEDLTLISVNMPRAACLSM